LFSPKRKSEKVESQEAATENKLRPSSVAVRRHRAAVRLRTAPHSSRLRLATFFPPRGRLEEKKI
ncbi:MAG: hypothetical protein ACLTAN_07905, partial [Christensenellaceae bacterium]